MALDLITTEFTSCALFSICPKSEKLFYEGTKPPYFQFYKSITNDIGSFIVIATVIRRSEALIWEGACDLLGRSVKEAASQIRGVYTFELLAFNALREMNSYSHSELAQVLVNSSRLLTPGQDLLIRYSSVYGILRKLGIESWGKINFLSSVEVLPDEPGSLYTLIGRAFKKTVDTPAPVRIVINDLSAVPIFDPHSNEQQLSFSKLKAKLAKSPPSFLREYWVDGMKIVL